MTNIVDSPDAEKILLKHFGEWGEIEHIRYLTGRGTAFVRYRYRANAEFAKEAMLGQSLEHNEILLVKWANDDPHEHLKELKKRKAEELVKKTITAKLPKIGDKGNVLDYENSYDSAQNANQIKAQAEAYPFYQENNDLQKQWEEYYANGGTPEAAAAYYAQMNPSSGQPAAAPAEIDYEKAKYGYSQEHYDQAEQAHPSIDYSVYYSNYNEASYAAAGNEAYAVGNEAYAVGNEAYAVVGNSTNTNNASPSTADSNTLKPIETSQPLKAAGLVAYGSDDDEEE